jgi:hypothetical protein
MKETQLTRGLDFTEIAKSGGHCLRDGSRYATCQNKYSLLSNAHNLCTESSKNVNYSCLFLKTLYFTKKKVKTTTSHRLVTIKTNYVPIRIDAM